MSLAGWVLTVLVAAVVVGMVVASLDDGFDDPDVGDAWERGGDDGTAW